MNKILILLLSIFYVTHAQRATLTLLQPRMYNADSNANSLCDVKDITDPLSPTLDNCPLGATCIADTDPAKGRCTVFTVEEHQGSTGNDYTTSVILEAETQLSSTAGALTCNLSDLGDAEEKWRCIEHAANLFLGDNEAASDYEQDCAVLYKGDIGSKITSGTLDTTGMDGATLTASSDNTGTAFSSDAEKLSCHFVPQNNKYLGYAFAEVAFTKKASALNAGEKATKIIKIPMLFRPGNKKNAGSVANEDGYPEDPDLETAHDLLSLPTADDGITGSTSNEGELQINYKLNVMDSRYFIISQSGVEALHQQAGNFDLIKEGLEIGDTYLNFYDSSKDSFVNSGIDAVALAYADYETGSCYKNGVDAGASLSATGCDISSPSYYGRDYAQYKLEGTYKALYGGMGHWKKGYVECAMCDNRLIVQGFTPQSGNSQIDIGVDIDLNSLNSGCDGSVENCITLPNIFAEPVSNDAALRLPNCNSTGSNCGAAGGYDPQHANGHVLGEFFVPKVQGTIDYGDYDSEFDFLSSKRLKISDSSKLLENEASSGLAISDDCEDYGKGPISGLSNDMLAAVNDMFYSKCRIIVKDIEFAETSSSIYFTDEDAANACSTDDCAGAVYADVTQVDGRRILVGDAELSLLRRKLATVEKVGASITMSISKYTDDPTQVLTYDVVGTDTMIGYTSNSTECDLVDELIPQITFPSDNTKLYGGTTCADPAACETSCEADNNCQGYTDSGVGAVTACSSNCADDFVNQPQYCGTECSDEANCKTQCDADNTCDGISEYDLTHQVANYGTDTSDWRGMNNNYVTGGPTVDECKFYAEAMGLTWRGTMNYDGFAHGCVRVLQFHLGRSVGVYYNYDASVGYWATKCNGYVGYEGRAECITGPSYSTQAAVNKWFYGSSECSAFDPTGGFSDFALNKEYTLQQSGERNWVYGAALEGAGVSFTETSTMVPSGNKVLRSGCQELALDSEIEFITSAVNGEEKEHTIRSSSQCTGFLDIQLRDQDHAFAVYDLRLPCSRTTAAAADEISLTFDFTLGYDLVTNKVTTKAYYLSSMSSATVTGLPVGGNAGLSQDISVVVDYGKCDSSNAIVREDEAGVAFGTECAASDNASGEFTDEAGSSHFLNDGLDLDAWSHCAQKVVDDNANSAYIVTTKVAMRYTRELTYNSGSGDTMSTSHLCSDRKFVTTINRDASATVTVATLRAPSLERAVAVTDIEWVKCNGENSFKLEITVSATQKENNKDWTDANLNRVLKPVVSGADDSDQLMIEVGSMTTYTPSNQFKLVSSCITISAADCEELCDAGGSNCTPQADAEDSSQSAWSKLSHTQTAVIMRGDFTNSDVDSDVNIVTRYVECPLDESNDSTGNLRAGATMECDAALSSVPSTTVDGETNCAEAYVTDSGTADVKLYITADNAADHLLTAAEQTAANDQNWRIRHSSIYIERYEKNFDKSKGSLLSSEEFCECGSKTTDYNDTVACVSKADRIFGLIPFNTLECGKDTAGVITYDQIKFDFLPLTQATNDLFEVKFVLLAENTDLDDINSRRRLRAVSKSVSLNRPKLGASAATAASAGAFSVIVAEHNTADDALPANSDTATTTAAPVTHKHSFGDGWITVGVIGGIVAVVGVIILLIMTAVNKAAPGAVASLRKRIGKEQEGYERVQRFSNLRY